MIRRWRQRAAVVCATTCIVGAAYGAALPKHPRDIVFPPAAWRPPAASEVAVDLAGGARAFVLQDETLPLVDLIVVARAGAHLDPPGQRGLAEMTTTLLRRGGAGDRSADEFDRRADEIGARLFSVPTALYGAVGVRCTADVLDEASELLLDVLEKPRFEEGRWRTIRGQALEAFSRRNLDGAQRLEREWDWLMYGDEHFSTAPIGPADLDRITPEAMRRFHRRLWRPENFVLAVAGAIDADRLKALFEPRLASWPAAQPTRVVWPPPPPDEGSGSGLFHIAEDLPQARVAIGHRAPSLPSSVEDRVELEVVAEILAGRGAVSRLNGRLRSAEGLVYRAWGELDPGDLWNGDYQLRFDALAASVPAAVAATLEELERLRTNPPHPDELAVVQRELLARQRQEFDTAEEAAGYLVQDALVGRSEDYRSRYRELVQRVTRETVVAAARRHLRTDRLVILVAGRWSELSGSVDDQGWTELERSAGRRVTHLPERDPTTLTLLPAGER